MSEPRTLMPQEWARRLVRSRNWFLYEAGAARRRAELALSDAARAEGHAAALETQILDLGFDPQPPMGPRAA